MADNILKSKRELIAEANKVRRDRIEEGNRARAAQREEARKINYLRQRREGMNIAYNQFKNSGTEGIETEPGMISKLFGVTKDEPKYQAAREMKKALESERARAGIAPKTDYPEYQEELETLYNRGTDPNVLQKKKKGGSIKAKCMSKGGMTASKRADGCCTKGKTKGRII